MKTKAISTKDQRNRPYFIHGKELLANKNNLPSTKKKKNAIERIKKEKFLRGGDQP